LPIAAVKPVNPVLLKFGAAVLGKISRVAANLRFAGWERSEAGATVAAGQRNYFG
jgi:hypothetical protein